MLPVRSLIHPLRGQCRFFLLRPVLRPTSSCFYVDQIFEAPSQRPNRIQDQGPRQSRLQLLRRLSNSRAKSVKQKLRILTEHLGDALLILFESRERAMVSNLSMTKRLRMTNVAYIDAEWERTSVRSENSFVSKASETASHRPSSDIALATRLV